MMQSRPRCLFPSIVLTLVIVRVGTQNQVYFQALKVMSLGLPHMVIADSYY